ncbi:MAG: hypothetical protein E7Z75_02810 [Methanobrevibacter olleyae]|uniref:Uncharacterized protein n=1 Tax=Methanobrevibacter olleyae TaxID=294671 RepID=A0A8T3VQ08_METOL|nr:hypothetical protein [Methanobrevibacter olleyae]
MAIGRRSRNSRNQQNKNVLITRNPTNSKNSRASRQSGRTKKPNGSLSSIWSKSSVQKKPRSPRQVLLMIIILIAFICGLALGISMITGIGSEPSSGEVQYMNVTDNITAYENSSYDLHDENGTQISYYDFHENVTEGQEITAFNASNSADIY